MGLGSSVRPHVTSSIGPIRFKNIDTNVNAKIKHIIKDIVHYYVYHRKIKSEHEFGFNPVHEILYYPPPITSIRAKKPTRRERRKMKAKSCPGQNNVIVNQLPDVKMNQLPDVKMNQLPDDKMNQLPDDKMNQLPDDKLNQLPDVEVNQLPDVKMNQLSDDNLNQLIDDRLNQMPDIRLNQLPDVEKNLSEYEHSQDETDLQNIKVVKDKYGTQPASTEYCEDKSKHGIKCICSNEPTPSSLRQCCLTCKRHKVVLLNIVKQGSRTYFIGFCDIVTTSKIIKIIPAPHSQNQYYSLGVINQIETDRASVIFFSDEEIELSDLESEGVPDFQVLPSSSSHIQMFPLGFLKDLENLISKSVIRNIDDSFKIYCDQPLAAKHADCQICRELHINLNLHKIR